MTKGPNPRPTRQDNAIKRRRAIIAAALAEFSDKGFAAARLEDIAARAEVAKGTIYLHFDDKRALFRGIVQEVIGPIVEGLELGSRDPGESLRTYLERVMVPLAAGLATSPRREVVRLVIAEGSRFPDIADIYYREIIERAVRLLRSLARDARERGEIAGETLERFPQLLAAPALMAVIWGGLFDRHEHLDVQAMLRAQLDLVLGPAPSSA